MYRINVYVPQSHVETVKQALFAAGAGRIGLYEHCCWQSQGTGQFKPMQGSDAFIGQVDVLEQVEEVKLELVCEQDHIKKALTAMINAHPYEEPAYDVYESLTLASFN